MKREFVCQEGGSNKFWNIEKNGTSYTVTYGKVGTPGTCTVKEWGSEEVCLKEIDKIVKSKTKKGYVEKEAGQGGQAEVKVSAVKTVGFKRTNRVYELKINEEALTIEQCDFKEGMIGDSDSTKTPVKSTYKSKDELNKYVYDLRAQLFEIGYVDYQPKMRFPLNAEEIDFYDGEEENDCVKKAFTHANKVIGDLKHFCLVAWDCCCEEDVESLEYTVERFIKQKPKYTGVDYFTFGDMDCEIAELTWLGQINYAEFCKNFSHIKGISTQGGNDLSFGKLDMPNLEIFECISSNLDSSIIDDLASSKLPNLKVINVMLGCEDYDSSVSLKALENSDFPNLVSIGLTNGDHAKFTEALDEVLYGKYAKQLKVLDFTGSISTDEHFQKIYNNLDKMPALKYINANYHFCSPQMEEKATADFKAKGIEVSFTNSQFSDVIEDSDDKYEDCYPMVTE